MIYLETSLSRCAVKGPNWNQLGGLTQNRGRDPSAGKIAKIELALLGVAMAAPIELIIRIALITLAFVPCIGTSKGRDLLGKIGLTILHTGAALLSSLKGLVTNVAFAFLKPRDSSRGNYLRV